ncbi:hypothetical protein ONS96_010551 [Cadophora gregata f. sp. sojae]|nr:hypothetical protein ONS96_010551 [Cadophora gregata f. sp. sojae]
MLLTFVIFATVSSAVAQTAANCSVKGSDTGKQPAFLTNPNITTTTGCKTFCAETIYDKCQSFAVGPFCLLYNVTVTGNVNVVSASPWTFYDAACKV